MSNLDVIFKIPLPRGGLILPLSFPQALSRVQSPLERQPSRISMDRPEMESRPYEFPSSSIEASIKKTAIIFKVSAGGSFSESLKT